MIIKRVIDECYKKHILDDSCEHCSYKGKQCERVVSLIIANTDGYFDGIDRKKIRPSDYITR